RPSETKWQHEQPKTMSSHWNEFRSVRGRAFENCKHQMDSAANCRVGLREQKRGVDAADPARVAGHERKQLRVPALWSRKRRSCFYVTIDRGISRLAPED